jgi:trans-2-enoyl-CoA reductase
VCGFNLRAWMNANKKRVPAMLETLAKLVNADKLRVNFTEYVR